jgi:type VI secretion system secreted protein VgrG
MAQLIAGADQGAHLPLRVGTEVLIAFVNGDPSRPVILAAVPNAHHPAAVTSSERAINVIRTAEKLTIRFGRSDVKA